MKKLTAEMKAELAKKKMEAEANAKIRTARPEPKFKAPDKPVKILREAPIDYYKGMNPVSKWMEVYEYEN